MKQRILHVLDIVGLIMLSTLAVMAATADGFTIPSRYGTGGQLFEPPATYFIAATPGLLALAIAIKLVNSELAMKIGPSLILAAFIIGFLGSFV